MLHKSDPRSLVFVQDSMPDNLTPNESVLFFPVKRTLANSIFCSLTLWLQSFSTDLVFGNFCVNASGSSSIKSKSSAYSDSRGEHSLLIGGLSHSLTMSSCI